MQLSYNLTEICATAALKMQHWQQKTFHGYMGTIANALYFVADNAKALVKKEDGAYIVKPGRLNHFVSTTDLQASVLTIGKQNVLTGWRPDVSFGTARAQAILCFEWLEDLGLWGDRESTKNGKKGNTPTYHSGINIIALLRLYETMERVYVEVGKSQEREEDQWDLDDLPRHKGNVVRLLFNAIFKHKGFGRREYNRVANNETGIHEETPIEQEAFKGWQESVFQGLQNAFGWMKLIDLMGDTRKFVELYMLWLRIYSTHMKAWYKVRMLKAARKQLDLMRRHGFGHEAIAIGLLSEVWIKAVCLPEDESIAVNNTGEANA